MNEQQSDRLDCSLLDKCTCSHQFQSRVERWLHIKPLLRECANCYCYLIAGRVVKPLVQTVKLEVRE